MNSISNNPDGTKIMDEQKSEQGNSDVVQSVGNSWIVCKSKSRPGYNYYFNTLNGQTLWNLSDVEIEKAKSNTKLLEDQSGHKVEQFPEPKDNPITSFIDQTNNDSVHSNIYNKQMINSQLPKPEFKIPPVANAGVSFNSMNSHNLISVPAPQPYNPFVWEQQPGQQLFTNPSVHPLTNPVQLPVIRHTQPSFAFNNVHVHRNKQVRYMPRNIQFVRGIRKPRANYKNIWFVPNKGSSNSKQFYALNKKKNDLRQRLHSKHFSNNMSNVDNEDTDNAVDEQDDYDGTARIGMHIENFQDKSTKIDLTPLRNLAPPDAKEDCWYIVADTGVILHNFNYLNNLTDSDNTCHLMVPKYVMSQLGAIAKYTQNDNGNARRIVRFLSQQIDSGRSFIDDASFYATDNETKILMDTCLELVQQNYHVVLISDNKELLERENTEQIPIFTIEDLNIFLKKCIFKRPNKIKFVPKHTIKITVPNNEMVNTMKSDNSLVGSEFSSTENIMNINATKCETPKINDITIERTASALIIPAMETGVQLDSAEQISNDNYDIKTDNKCNITKEYIAVDKNVPKNNDICPFMINTYGQKKIKLNRSISCQNPLDNELASDQKRYKWRNKRKITTVTMQTNKSLPSYSRSVSSNSHDQTQQSPRVKHDSSIDESIVREQSASFSCRTSKSRCNDITSDSNITLNTNSTNNVNASTTKVTPSLERNNDYMCNETNVKPKSSFVIENRNNGFLKHVIFEITDKGMEEYLTMRLDEWVSRFVQIMEEALTQVLQRDPPFTSKEFPPPWTLHEATQCIIKKFSSCYVVVDAANKLSIVLFGSSDNKGKITTNMKPSEFMEMYSYGVYLVDSLQDLSKDCEDLQIAAASLKKILIDIQNPNMDCGHNNTFTESLHEPHMDVMQTTYIEEKAERHNNETKFKSESSKQQADDSTGNSSHKKYKFLSSVLNQDVSEDYEELGIAADPLKTFYKHTSNVDCDYSDTFTENLHEPVIDDEQATHIEEKTDDSVHSLSLGSPCRKERGKILNITPIKYNLRSSASKQRREKPQEHVKKKYFLTNLKLVKKTVVACNKKIKPNTPCGSTENKDEANFSDKSSDEIDKVTNAPKIVRHFRKYSMFEERLQKRKDIYGLDYESDESLFQSGGEEVTMEPELTQENCHTESVVNTCETDVEGHERLRHFIGIILKQVMDTFTKTKTFCKKSIDILRVPNQSKTVKVNICKKAERASTSVIHLYRTLDSIHKRETEDPENNISMLIKRSGIAISIDENLLAEYRNIVTTLKDHAKDLQTSIKLIITAANG